MNGFLGGEWNEYKGYVAVRAGDAHSWDEVYYPGVGWVTVDPTPPGDVDALGRGGQGFAARLGRFVDTLRFQWNKWVIEYDLASQLSLFRSVGSALQGAAATVKAGLVAVKNGALRIWPVLVAIGLWSAVAAMIREERNLAARERRLDAGPAIGPAPVARKGGT